MRINKVFFAYIQKHKKGKIISGILCLLALCILLLILPNHGVMANETPTTVSTDNEYTVYFDASNYTNDEWITKYGVGIYGFDENGNNENSGGPYKMNVSDRGDHIYAYTFDRAWSKVIFTKGASWDNNVQTIDLTVNWSMDSPCFVMSSGSGKNYSGTWHDLGPNNPSIQPITELNSNHIYLDVSGMSKNSNADWTTRNDELYLYISTLPASENQRLCKADGLVRYKNITFVYWDVSNIQADASGSIAFLYDDSWEHADTQEYFRTSNLDETTLESAKGNAYYWNGYEKFLVNGVWTYRLDTVDFDSTYESDYSKGDQSKDIPVTNGSKEVVKDAYYATSTFYDYYSDYEMKSGQSKKNCSTTGVSSADYKNQFQYFNRMIAQYFRSKNAQSNPLYFGDFWEQKNQSYWSDSQFDSNWNLYNFNYYKNNSANFSTDAYQGLVDSTLSNGKVTMNQIEVPYFNTSFLRNKNTPLAAVYDQVAFPFTLNSNGYWEFDSAESSYALQMKESNVDGYYLQRTGVGINGLTGENVETMGFFPFNDSGQSGNVNKLDYGFGMEMEIPFTLSEDGTIEMNGANKDIVFDFSGDDDIWIYIDGNLVLDIGGDHGRVYGSINFNTQTSTVSGTKDANGEHLGPKSTPFANVLPKSSYTDEHVMKIFYMERGVWESNMKITFNFPERNNLQVEKEVEIPSVDAIFNESMNNLKNMNFDFSIKNLVTDTIAYVGGSTEAKEKIYNTYTTTDKSQTLSKVSNVSASFINKDGKDVISWYAPGEKKSSDGQAVTDKRIVKITPADQSSKQSYINVSNTADYLTFETYQDSSENGTAPFIALVDGDGTRIGAWANQVSYQNSSNTMGSKIWRTMKIDLSALQDHVLANGSITGFDFTKVVEIQFAYWNDVNVYISPFTFHKSNTSSDMSNGFSTDPSTINDYGSLASKVLEKASGATYSIAGGSLSTSEYREVTDGMFSLSNNQVATFRNQFRKGSYIAISEIGLDPNIFSTIWTVTEDNQTISPSALNQVTTNVQQTKELTSLSRINGLEAGDGRLVKQATSGISQPDHAIAFYRYDDPDSTKSSTNLKIKYTNTLKTGSLTLKKSIKDGEQFDPNKTYKFIVSFENVAGLGLEGQNPIEDTNVSLTPGSEYTMQGIPAGTTYTIKEVKEIDDEFTLHEIKHDETNTNITIDLTTYSASGIINDTKTTLDYVNSIFPTIELQGQKYWEDQDSPSRPESITIQLERKIKGTADSTYEIAKDKTGNKIAQKVVSIHDNWNYSYFGLPKYVDYLSTDKVEYVYRVVEIKVGDNLTADSQYRPEYFTDEDGHQNIRNIEVGSIKIKKVDENNQPLLGASFVLEKKNEENQWIEIKVMKMLNESEAVFNNLERGDYRIREILAPEGYNILKDPILVSLPLELPETTTDGVQIDVDGPALNVTFTITNVKGSILPSMGGTGNYIYIILGAILLCVSFYMCVLMKREMRYAKHSLANCSKTFCSFKKNNKRGGF
ncbi:hypothetical protein A4S06_06860 [Erysipelotrichaceae bacterium MTC7]|nr:hypothetical protein A4S06_06860 [Erysipelotrichaceae bacterium MTC7]